jgi:hypothetical protein
LYTKSQHYEQKCVPNNLIAIPKQLGCFPLDVTQATLKKASPHTDINLQAIHSQSDIPLFSCGKHFLCRDAT